MTAPVRPRVPPGVRRALPVVFLATSLGFVGILAWQTVAAERARARTARQTREGYAGVVAFQMAAQAFQTLTRDLAAPFDALDRAPPGTPGVDALLGAATEAARCAGAARWAFRVPLTDASGTPVDGLPIEWAGAEPPAAVRAWVERTFRASVADPMDLPASYDVVVGGPGTEPTVVAAAVRWRPGEHTSRYGVRTCLRTGEDHAFRAAMTGRTLLPPTLTGGVPPDSLVGAELVLAGRGGIWTSPGGLPEGDAASVVLWPPLDELTLAVALRPTAAATLVPGADGGGASLPVVLFLLNAALLGAALVQMRREGRLVALREEFVGAVSHELRTPLQQMVLYGDLLQLGRLESTEERERAAEVVARETRRLIHLVDNVLAFRPAHGTGPLPTVRPWPLDPFVDEVVAEFRPLARARDVTLQSEAGCALRVTWPPDAVRRILLNLLDNAVKYGPPGGTVTVRTAPDGSGARLSVEDEGPGIPLGERRRVFEAYYRCEREAGGDTGGTGIGLALVAELAARGGGACRVEEAAGGGARVSVTMPVGSVAGADT